jgi:hypothetical protein
MRLPEGRFDEIRPEWSGRLLGHSRRRFLGRRSLLFLYGSFKSGFVAPRSPGHG